jgi:hypothetical protein
MNRIDVDMTECLQMAVGLRQKLNEFKKLDPEVFSILDDTAKIIFKMFVRRHMTSIEFACLCAMLSLQSAEIFIRERSTIICQSATDNGKQV